MPLSPQEFGTRRVSKRVIDFNILVVGENGVGKKSMVNSLCEQPVFKIHEPNESNTEFSIELVSTIVTKDFPIRVNVHYTRNYGFNLNNHENSSEILEFLESKLHHKYVEENKTTRQKIDDLIHLVMVVVEPLNKGLKPQDIDLIRQIGLRANVMVVISKCDLVTKQELETQKALINISAHCHQLQLYNFVDSTMESDEEIVSVLADLQSKQPFGVINGNSPTFLIRKGLTEIDIEKYSDVSVVKDTLFCINLGDFKELTNNIIYEKYRTERLLSK